MRRAVSFVMTLFVFIFGFINEALPKPKPTGDKSVTSGKMTDITRDSKVKLENLEGESPMERLETVEDASGDEMFSSEIDAPDREATDEGRFEEMRDLEMKATDTSRVEDSVEQKRNLEREASKKRWKR